jgi:hypothetical protein
MKKLITFIFACAWMFVITAHAEATLSDRGLGTITGISGEYKLIYDNELDVTWLDYSAAAANWADQATWASGLEVTFGGRSFNNWRLPEVDESVVTASGVVYGYEGPDTNGFYDYLWGYNMMNSEMGHLFYASLGNPGMIATDGSTQPVYGLLNSGPFDHLQATFYWSETGYSQNANWAWGFGFGAGSQNGAHKNWSAPLGLALMPGDISAVPIPGAIWLLSPGLAGLLIIRGKRQGR